MVGFVIVGHGSVAEALIATAQGIVGPLEQVRAVNLLPHEGIDLGRAKIVEAIHAVNDGEGVVLLADMFGGTPSNCCLSVLEQGQLEVVTGYNLPMLLKIPTARAQRLSVRDTAQALVQNGQKNILFASDLLRARCQAVQG
jgi:PTS system mannose-specific IIA component